MEKSLRSLIPRKKQSIEETGQIESWQERRLNHDLQVLSIYDTFLIATEPEAAVKKYQKGVAGSVENVSFEEISQFDFLDQLTQMTTECGLNHAALEILKAVSCLINAGKEAIIVFKKC